MNYTKNKIICLVLASLLLAAPAATAAPPITQTEITTGLLHLKVKSIPVTHLGLLHPALKGSMRMTAIGKDVLLLITNKFYHFNPATEKMTPLNITPPRNNYQFTDIKLSPTNRFIAFYRYEDIQVIQIKNKPLLLLSYTFYDPKKKCLALKLVRAPLGKYFLKSTIQEKEWKIIFESPCFTLKSIDYHQGDENGGAIGLSKNPNKIYFSLSALGRNHTQGKNHPEQKYPYAILEIDVETGEKKVFAEGLRNPQGLALDKQNRLWATDHGPRGGDEVNLIQKGKHYGWPQVSYGTRYGYLTHDLKTPQGFHRKEGVAHFFSFLPWVDKYTKPSFAFMPAIGISDILMVKNFAPQWNGDLLVAALRGRALHRVRLDGTRGVYAEKIVLPPRTRLRNIMEHPDGFFIATSDFKPQEGEGSFLYIIRLDEKKDVRFLEKKNKKHLEKWAQCLTCHTLTPSAKDDETRAPSLKKLFSKKAGSGNWPHYTDAMKNSKIVWTDETLRAFLANPQAVIPKTSMPLQALTKDETDFIMHQLKKTSQ